MNYKDVLIDVIDEIKSDQGLKVFAKGLYGAEIIIPTSYLGGSDVKEELKKELAQANLNDETKNRKFIHTSSSRISEIYMTRQKRVSNVFYLSLISIGFAIALLIAGIAVSFIEKSQVKLGIITSLSSIFPGILSGTTFWLYKNETENLKPVEHDLIAIARLESYLEMTEFITDDNLKAKVYETVIRKMDPQKRVLVL